MITLTREQSRRLDRLAMDELGIPGIVLMENAGRGMASLLLGLGIDGSVAICCGVGNNGGDGFVIARHLAIAGVKVQIGLFALPDKLQGDALTNYHIVQRMGLPLHVRAESQESTLAEWFGPAEWIVDGLCGTGTRLPVRPPYDGAIRAMNAAGKKVFAVDIPSGLDCDTGEPTEPTVRATHTATVAALKQGFQRPIAQPYLGKLHVIDMGVPNSLLQQMQS